MAAAAAATATGARAADAARDVGGRRGARGGQGGGRNGGPGITVYQPSPTYEEHSGHSPSYFPWEEGFASSAGWGAVRAGGYPGGGYHQSYEYGPDSWESRSSYGSYEEGWGRSAGGRVGAGGGGFGAGGFRSEEEFWHATWAEQQQEEWEQEQMRQIERQEEWEQEQMRQYEYYYGSSRQQSPKP